MERRFAVHARALALIAVLAGSASAAPKKHGAKLQFKKGVAAYQKGDFAEASTAFARSYKLEVDQETLFAWAQSERKLDHCDRATELYTMLLRLKLPAANRAVVTSQIDECKDVLAAQAKAAEPASAPAPVEPPPSEPAAPPQPAPAPSPLPQLRADSPLAQPAVQRDIAEPTPHAWYRDPVGDSLLGVGIGGLGAGAGLVLAARSADHRAAMASTYDAFRSLEQTAHSRGEMGVAAASVGATLVAAAVVWYLER